MDDLFLERMNMLSITSDDRLDYDIKPLSQEVLYRPEGADLSDAEVYNRLGRMYFDGDGVAENGPKAVRYFEIAYNKGARNIRTGDYLMMGVYRQIETRRAVLFGLTKDSMLAIKWYMQCLEKCIDNSDTEGILLLFSHIGRAFLDDHIREYELAYHCLKFASDQQSEALFYLAWMYERGLYVQKDRDKSEYYINRILEASKYANDPFYDCAKKIKECWSFGAPDEIIDRIVDSLG